MINLLRLLAASRDRVLVRVPAPSKEGPQSGSRKYWAMDKLDPQFFGLLFPFFFVGLWVTICQIISWGGGWSRLATQWPDDGRGGREPIYQGNGISGRVGWASYN